MKRRGFINLAFLLPLIPSLKSVLKDDELLHFNLAELDPLLKNITPADQAKADLLRKNLAFDVRYVLERINNLDDMEKIRSLALEADKKFYADSRLTAKEFNYQAINIAALEEFRNFTGADTKEFDGMIKDIRVQLTGLQASPETYVREAVKKLAGIGPQKYMRTTTNGNEQPAREKKLMTGIKDPQKKERTLNTGIEEQPNHGAIKKAAEAQECARTWQMVGCIVAVIIAIVVAIVVTVFSYGTGESAAGLSAMNAIIGAAMISGQVISVTNNTIKIDNTTIALKDTKADLGKMNLDSLLKCCTSAAAVTAAMSYFGKTSYPANPLAASLTVSLIGIVGRLPGFDVCS